MVTNASLLRGFLFNFVFSGSVEEKLRSRGRRIENVPYQSVEPVTSQDDARLDDWSVLVQVSLGNGNVLSNTYCVVRTIWGLTIVKCGGDVVRLGLPGNEVLVVPSRLVRAAAGLVGVLIVVGRRREGCPVSVGHRLQKGVTSFRGTYPGDISALNVKYLVDESVKLVHSVVVGQRERVGPRVARRVVAVEAAFAVEGL